MGSLILGREIKPQGVCVETERHRKIYLLGEAPGEKENRIGKNFVGGSGTLLFTELGKQGVHRHHVRVGNCFWRRPPDNRIDIVRNSDLFRHYVEKAKEDIRQTKPDVIIALGAVALEVLTNETAISSCRGYWFEFEGIPVMPTWHPASVLRNWEKQYLPFVCDLAKAIKGSRQRPEFKQDLTLHKDNLEVFCAVCENPPPVVALDLEVEARNHTTTVVGIAYSETEAVNVYCSQNNLQKVNQALQKLVKRTKRIVCHNAAFEMQWLWMFHQVDLGLPDDTMLMHHLLFLELDKSLDFCASVHLDVPRWKFMFSEDKLTYNLLDCIVTLKLDRVLQEQLERLNYTQYYEKKRRELRPAVHASMLGLKLNQERLQELIDSNQEAQQEPLAKLLEIAGSDFNPNSPVQMKKLLYETWNLPKQKAKGKVTTGEDAIKKLVRKADNPVIKEFLVTYREWKKLSSIYSKELRIEPDPHTGRVHTGYNIAGTAGSRWSSSALFFLKGTNLQNRSKPNRVMFEPPIDGWVMISRDYSGAEARVVAWRCNDEVLMEAFQNGLDVHKLTAALMFGIPVEEVTKDLRQIGKRMRHAGNYGMSWKTVADQMEISAAEAKDLLNRFHSSNPKVRAIFHEQTKQLVMKHRSLKNPFGLIRVFSGRLTDDKTFREAYAFYPQTTVTDALNRAIVDFYKWQEDKKWVSFLLQIHDEFIAICEPQAAPEVLAVMKQFMEFPIPIECLETGAVRELVLPTDSKVGWNWGDMFDLSDEEEAIADKLLLERKPSLE